VQEQVIVQPTVVPNVQETKTDVTVATVEPQVEVKEDNTPAVVDQPAVTAPEVTTTVTTPTTIVIVQPTPITQPATTTKVEEVNEMHTVAARETLYSISKQYGVTVEQIQQWNSLKGNAISVGQKLTIKVSKEVTVENPSVTNPGNTNE